MPSGVTTSVLPPGDDDQRRVAGARAGQRHRVEIDDGVGHRDEAAVVEMLGQQTVDRRSAAAAAIARVWLSASISPFSSAM